MTHNSFIIHASSKPEKLTMRFFPPSINNTNTWPRRIKLIVGLLAVLGLIWLSGWSVR